jgi:carboxyl-terminal processing protease
LPGNTESSEEYRADRSRERQINGEDISNCFPGIGGRKKEISSDSFLYYGACDMLIDGKRLEGVGVEPDIEVPFDIRFAAGRDIQLQRAEDEIVRLIEAMS